ncbi:MAG: Uncharacterised protein [SAR116 cluster bacterium]|nr:MAG: Uncharacterised protein [SAR116 cluster bacterium]
MNSSFCGLKDGDRSTSSASPVSSYSFLVRVLIFRTVPVSTAYFCSSTGLPSLFRIGLPSPPVLRTQFFRSMPMPPVTPTVVWKIGEMPLVPATMGAILTNGTYLLACLPVHRATLFTPDIRDEPTPIVPFSATSMTCLPGCCSFSALISACARSEIMHLPCSSRSARECAWLPGDSRSVEISPSPAM